MVFYRLLNETLEDLNTHEVTKEDVCGWKSVVRTDINEITADVMNGVIYIPYKVESK